MSAFLLVGTAWLIIAILLAGTALVIYLGIDTVIRGWQLLEQARRDREEKR